MALGRGCAPLGALRGALRCLSTGAPQGSGRVLRVDRAGLLSAAPPSPARALAQQAQSALQSSLRASIGGAAAPPAPPAPADSEEDTPLASLLRASILARGPVSMADFMGLCLSHPQFGYYMQPGPVLGRAGDFVTSPEISQLFGELLGVWCVAAAQALPAVARADAFRLVEGGPGRGTLAAAVLGVLARFPRQAARLHSVHLVETSPALRRAQALALGCPLEACQAHEGSLTRGRIAAGPFAGTPVHWWGAFADLPPGAPAITLCHELFDALPVHQLAYTLSRGGLGEWREILVDVAHPSAGAGAAQGLRNVLSPSATPASAAFAAWLASAAGARYAALCGAGQGAAAAAAAPWPVEGDVAEVSPASQHLFHALAARVGEEGGAALVVDYGSARGARALSLRGIRRHAFVDIFSAPGRTDLSADVDFACLKAVGQGVAGVAVLGPAEQGLFLQRLGLGARVARLAEGKEAQVVAALEGQAQRLASPQAMGSIFKAMAVVPEGCRGALEGVFGAEG